MAKRAYRGKTRCTTVVTGTGYSNGRLDGRRVAFKVCTMRNGISVQRLGRRGGARRMDATRGGMTACTAKGQNSKCVRGAHIVLLAGGSGKLRKHGVEVFNGR